MQDRVPTPGQEGRVLITPESGNPFYAKIKMADNPTQEGDPLNKSTLLKDSTASLFGENNTALPDDIFQILSKAALYSEEELTTVTGSKIPQIDVEIGSYIGTGTYGSNNKNTLTFSHPPQIVIVLLNRAVRQLLLPGNIFIKGQNGSSGLGLISNVDNSPLLDVSWSNNSISFYTSKTDSLAPGYQMNYKGYQYIYLGIYIKGEN